MSVRSKFDQNLEALLSTPDLEDIDDLEDEEESTPLELIEYEQAESAVAISEDDSAEEQDRKSDYQFARNIYRGMLTRGISVLELATIMAKESEHPKAFESVAKLIKEIADTNERLVNLHNKKGGTQKAQSITNNTQVNNYNAANDKNQIESFLDNADDDEEES